MNRWAEQKTGGFTIVELLIVVVVIAILAAVTIVAFNGIQDRARLSALKSNLSSAARAAEAFKAGSSTESYPTTLEEAKIPQGNDVFLQISADNNANPKTFCITAIETRKPGVAYRITQSGSIENGQCAGHTTNPGFTNLANNVGFENASGTVVSRTNLFLNPRQVTGGTIGSGWTPVTGQTEFGGITTAVQGVADGAWKSFYVNGSMPSTGTATPIAIRFWAKTNQPGWSMQNLSNNITVTSSWGGVLTRLDTNQTVSDIVADDVAREYGLTFTVPTTQTTAWNFGFKHNSSTAAPGKTITATGFIAELANAPGVFFDGTSSGADGMSFAWTGTPNNSTSVQQGAPVTGTGSNRVTSVRSSAWSAAGTYSLMQVPNSTTSTDNFTELLGGSGAIIQQSSLQPSTQYTLMATVRVESPLIGSLSGVNSRALFVHLNGAGVTLTGTRQAPNTPGVYDLRATFTTPSSFTGYNTIRLYHGGTTGSGYLWWDRIGLVQGDYTGVYFE